LPPEQRLKLTDILGAQLKSPDVFKVLPHNETVNVVFPLDQQFTIMADGRIREQQWADGTGFKISARADGEKLFLSSIGDNFTADMKVEPIAKGEKLAVTRTIQLIGHAEPVTWTAVYDRYQPGALFQGFSWHGMHGAGVGWPLDTITGELQESISTDVLTHSKFSLKVTAPDYLAGATITGRISKRGHDPETGVFRLDLDFDDIRLPNGATAAFRGEVKQIVSSGGGTIADELDLKKRRLRSSSSTGAGAVPVAEPQATYSLDRPLVVDKGSKIVINLPPML
jgi:hypothetical protein